MKNSHNGDFESLISEHTNDMYKLAYRLTGTREAAEDLVQDMFLSIFPNGSALQEVKHPRAWLSTVLYRTFIRNWRRDNKAFFRQYRADNFQVKDHCANFIVENTVCQQQGPEDRTMGSQLMHHLSLALDAISEDQRAVIILHDVEGYTLVELETMLETPLGTLKSRLHRARNKVENLLRSRGLI